MRKSFSPFPGVHARQQSRCAEGRSFCLKAAAKGVDAIGGPLDLDGHAAGIVADETGQSLFLRKAVDEGTEANALDDALNLEGLAPRFEPFSFWMRVLNKGLTSHRRKG